jgi:aminoglycoside phosphotransferase (APT) family kinase protein
VTEAARVASWVNRATGVRIDESAATLTRLPGGNSNETYLLRDGQRALVIRRPPRHRLDASAHSMGREHRVLRALASTGVPHAPLVGYCDDEAVLGAEFLVSEYVPGALALFDEIPEAYHAYPRPVKRIGHALVDALAELPAVDWLAAGLAGFGRPDGFLERQVPRWEAQYRRNQVRDLPDFEAVTRWLHDTVPQEQPAALMHGDFHLDNCLFATDQPDLLAVVDWEMSTVGDPLVDLGLCLAFWGPRRVSDPAMPRIQAVSREPGAPSRDELAERYAHRTGRDLTYLRWYEVFALWKLAVVIEPAYGQYLRGELSTDYAIALRSDVPGLLREAAAVAGIYPAA